MLHIDQTPVTVGDTVGAGDSFMAGLISGLLDAVLLGSPQARDRLAAVDWPDVQPALLRAIYTSALTVSRSGAYAPSRAEVHRASCARPGPHLNECRGHRGHHARLPALMHNPIHGRNHPTCNGYSSGTATPPPPSAVNSAPAFPA
ncbi:PfkB family carbohydrate kinase [Rhodococcus opacus]|uniref:PfkB family carbohydrate kinase n=1 Tax=Rhodococcus opacus TaxID=37919 RepID=UPI002949F2DB|nr:PfkB family carbohydrate kinase [Rhodococcus opacus]MDV6244845.1 PfkB family carbohydrate kinase [Rhodococcus opacus]